MNEKIMKPDYLFEISWEICNKIGGINTVVATKSSILNNEFKDNFILIGPDLWRETKKNPVFLEDEELFASWRKRAANEGFRVRVGRWDIAGQPIVILVDFTTMITMKDDIFKSYWERYGLDSISGGIDYIEAAVFGYVAGKVIQSFYSHSLTIRDKVLAHFHEWMCGTGVLYLKENVPQIATVFTTHATVVGRAIAANGIDLYGKLKELNGDSKAKELNVVAKQSLEKITANNADCFTTVSEITSLECEQFLGRKVDVITPNGFEDNFVPIGDAYDEAYQSARQKFINVAENILGYDIPEDVLLVANSGRYEFRNKGIDVFIKTLGQLNGNEKLEKQVIAFVLVPANNYGPKKDLLEKIKNKDSKTPISDPFLTHGLHDPEYDAIYNQILASGLTNKEEDNVKIIYVPSYLDGYDGIFNCKYYDLLIGLDLTIFPSYYEPWGYTPLESIAFSVPTITTNLAGIGMWVNRELININDGIDVFERKVGFDQNLIDDIINRIIVTTHKSPYDRQRARENAFSISRIALWRNLIHYYFDAYKIALTQVQQRADKFVELAPKEHFVIAKPSKSNNPIWRQLNISSKLPEQFQGLDEISKNLWWTWNFKATDLFEYISPELWESNKKSPIMLLKEVSNDRLLELENDQFFMEEYNNLYTRFKAYLKEGENKKEPNIAYFSMEYGLSDTLKIFSGGLGILAGDYLKEASDININLVGIGFLYKYGYFTQQLSIYGEQLSNYEPQNFSDIPVSPVYNSDGNFVTVQVAFPGRIIHARVWRAAVGRISLYLLDTDFDMNSPEDRSISHQLYGGDNEHRLKQEMILGIGGIRALDKLNIDMDIYHCNEGHAAFIGVERLRSLINEKNFTYAESLEIVRASTLFTTHTPVPAGHDSFPEDLVMIYMGHYPERLKISWDEFINLGRMHPGDKAERFSMSHLAVNLSQEINGVSKLHGDVTKYMFCDMWQGYYPNELNIGYVTNGVHFGSWVAKQWKQLYIGTFGREFLTDQSNKKHWSKIYNLKKSKIWETRQLLRKKLIDHIKERFDTNLKRRHVNPRTILQVQNKLDDKALTIGFARRFATYKRAHLLFDDLKRLAKIVNNPEQPIQFIFAGKAHPADSGGQGLIKKIVEISNMPEFLGKIIFLENYDIELAKKLVQGVDIWLNTPTRPLEASGTSGMKAVMNGVLNFSVLDGWWVEGYKEGAGWSLPLEKTYNNQDFQDDLDAETIYGKLENEVLPLFYDRNEDGVPENWVSAIQKCIAEIAPEFTTKRMIDDYINRFYGKLSERTKEMRKNDFEMPNRISTWKKRVSRAWDNIEIIENNILPQSGFESLTLGNVFKGSVGIDLHELEDIEVGIEFVVTEKSGSKDKIVSKSDFKMVKKEGSKQYFEIDFVPNQAGIYNYGIRIYPKNKDIPNRQDFSYLKWI